MGEKKDVITFYMMIQCLSSNAAKGSWRPILSYFNLLKSRAKQDTALEPDKRIYQAVISGLGNSGNNLAAWEAYDVFQELQTKNPQEVDVIMYLTLLNALSHAGDEKATNTAFEILEQAEESWKVGRLAEEPNLRLYEAVFKNLVKNPGVGNGKKANELLVQMIQRFQRDGRESLRPDSSILNMVIDAWANSDDPLKAGNAMKVLEYMMKLNQQDDYDVWLTPYPFNRIIYAAATTAGEESLGIAENMFRQLREHPEVNPDGHSYGLFIMACANLISDEKERHERITETFNEARVNGFVDDDVVVQVENALPGFFVSLGHEPSAELPNEWSFNIIQEKKRRLLKDRTDRNLELATRSKMRKLTKQTKPTDT